MTAAERIFLAMAAIVVLAVFPAAGVAAEDPKKPTLVELMTPT